MAARIQAGFTLIEAMLAVTIVGILLGTAIPAWQQAAINVRATTVRSELAEAIVRGSTLAITAQTDVVLCPSDDGRACRNDADWSDGWIVFADPDRDRQHTGNEALLLTRPKLSGADRLLTSAGRPRMVFQPHGGNAGTNLTFTVCNRNAPARLARSLVIANSGRWRLTDASQSAAITCVLGG